jgi:excisionase family DNA binding protein
MTPHQDALTTQEAADLLNVSRSFLIGLVDAGQAPHHKVGTDCRVRFEDLMTYKRRQDAEGEAALKELAVAQLNSFNRLRGTYCPKVMSAGDSPA